MAASLSASYFTRRVNKRDYWYLQHVVGSDKRSLYLGPDTAEWRRLIDRCKQRQDEDRPARTSRKQMVAVCAAKRLDDGSGMLVREVVKTPQQVISHQLKQGIEARKSN